jgi:hypothetical protein
MDIMNKLYELVFTALGQASMCWSKTPSGIFNDVKATQIGNELIKNISAEFGNTGIKISNGELLDKISILEIKLDKLTDVVQLHNVGKEKALLLEVAKPFWSRPDIYEFYMQLLDVNKMLWTIEDSIREKEKKREFDADFIEYARAVYMTNDKRSEIKAAINKHTKSDIVEEKSYAKY